MTGPLRDFQGEDATTKEPQRAESAPESFSVLEFLHNVSLFQFLSPEELKLVASRFQMQAFRAGEAIFLKDDPGTTLHIIVAGTVKIFLPSTEGEEAPLALLKAGDYFGELALLDGGSRTASATALSRTATFTLERDEFLEFITTHPPGAAAVFRALASLVRRQNLQLFGEFFEP